MSNTSIDEKITVQVIWLCGGGFCASSKAAIDKSLKKSKINSVAMTQGRWDIPAEMEKAPVPQT